jgi:hypothetical protein
MARFIHTEAAKLKAYYKLSDDGAGYRCRDCEETLPAGEVLLPAPFTPVCMNCLTDEWIESATCLGVK